MPYLLFLFTVVPVVELFLLIKVGDYIGGANTVLLVLVTGIGGASLAKMEGLATLQKIQKSTAQGQLPGRELINGLLILLGGAFLITPGVITDVIGLCMILPGTRTIVREILILFLKKRVAFQVNTVFSNMGVPSNGPAASSPSDGEVIDGEVVSSKEV